MEPMNLGSPGSPGSPANSPYLPSFFMGEPDTPTTSRNNTFSPNKAVGRPFGFTNSPAGVASGTQDSNRSASGQKTLFGGYQQTPTSGQNASNYIGTPLNTSVGPPVQGLFDSLRNERNQVETPLRTHQTNETKQFDRSSVGQRNINFALNQSMQQQLINLNDSLLSSNTSRNLSRNSIMSPIMRGDSSGVNTMNTMNLNSSQVIQCEARARYKEFWVTVYGFPSTAISTILQHFSQCGTIVDTVMPSQNGNWIHLKYSSRLECDKALNYNEKILGNNIMIGVTQCKDKDLLDKENVFDNTMESTKARPLAQASYKNTPKDTYGPNDISSVQKNGGLVDKALDLLFGW
uniref:Nucleoporin NUP53 n=1 Tax=Glossina austeni TaxID=7395 RepID=A0A1A9V8J2_GLOAU